MFDWNDLRCFLAVARDGSTLAAAKTLGLSQSTVHRRLLDLEAALGRDLVNRHPTGHRVSEFGAEMLPLAEQVERAVLSFANYPTQYAKSVAGIIRVTCPEPIVYRLSKSALLDRFHSKHPELRVEFVMSDAYVDLAKGEADVAFRSGDTDDGVLVGRKIADSIWAVYASREYVDLHGAPQSVDDLRRHPLIGLDVSMSKHRLSVWLDEVAPDARYAARNSSILGLVSAARAGVGIAPLPTALGDAEPDLVRVIGPVDALARSWRLLVHPDVRRTPRVATFFDFMIGEIEALKPILTG